MLAEFLNLTIAFGRYCGARCLLHVANLHPLMLGASVVEFVDAVGVDTTGRQAIDRDAVAGDFCRQRLAPGANGGPQRVEMPRLGIG